MTSRLLMLLTLMMTMTQAQYNDAFEAAELPTGYFLSTRAYRQGVDISVTVLCVFVCLYTTVTDFSAEDKASGVKFFPAVFLSASK